MLKLSLYLISFFLLWLGSGLIVTAVDKFSTKIRVSSFAFSFFILGLLTSIPEFAVGLTGVSEKKPEVFIGNLIGGIPIIFFLIIPILAILGNGVKLQHNLTTNKLLLSFIVILAPAFFVIDKNITRWEALCMISLYFLLFFFIQKDKGILDTADSKVLSIRAYSYKDLIRILLGVGIVFVASQYIVDTTLYFANIFNVSTFYISLILLSLGTNLPELSLAIRSVIANENDVAFGDYIGSAAANTFLFGLFAILSSKDNITTNNFFSTFLIMIMGVVVFFFFTRSRHDISRKEGFILLLVYILFLVCNGIYL